MTKAVERAIKVLFPESQRELVRNSLNNCRVSESERVHLAILVLTNGDIAELQPMIDAANTDYRDVLYWAEYPEESGEGTNEEMAERYRRIGAEPYEPFDER